VDEVFGTHRFIQQIFSAWDEPTVQVPLELGRRQQPS
jgi:hypothetical protein